MKQAAVILLVTLSSFPLNGQMPELTRPVALEIGSQQLQFDLPVSWQSRVRRGLPGLPSTLVMRAAERRVEILVSPLPMEADAPPTVEEVRKWVEGAAEVVQPTAVEKKLEIRSLAGGRGYYFAATDRAPGPGEFEYMAQGAFLSGSFLVSFTILTHEAPPPGLATALMILGSGKLDR